MQIKMNPKAPEDYLKMFNSYFKCYKVFEHAWNDLNKYIWELDIPVFHDEYGGDHDKLSEEFADYFNKKIFGFYEEHIDQDQHGYLGSFVRDAMKFLRNDRIESILKYYNALLTNYLILVLDDVEKRLKQLENEDMNTFVHLLNYYYERVVKVTDHANKILINYNTKNIGLERDNSPFAFLEITQLKHYLDLYKSDKDRYRPVNDYSWANKTLSKIKFDLDQIVEEIDAKFQTSSKEYKRWEKEQNETTEYLKIDTQYSWYFIAENFCNFEAYLAGPGHCGADGDADFLFSLRSIKPNGDFDSHVTISVKAWKVSPDTKYADMMKYVFDVRQVKGKSNNPPKKDYWPMIMELFKLPEFGWQTVSSYKSDNDFSPVWYEQSVNEAPTKKEISMVKAFYKSKPWWHNTFEAIDHYQLLNADFKEYFIKNIKSSEVRIEGSSVVVEFNFFYEMIEAISDWCDEFERAAKVIDQGDDYIDYSGYQYDDDDLLEVFKEHYPKLYKELEKIAEHHDERVIDVIGDKFKSLMDDEEGLNYSLVGIVREAFNTAHYRAEESGTSSARYDAYLRAFDELDLYNSDDEQYAVIEKTNEKHKYVVSGKQYESDKWKIEFDGKMLLQYYDSQGEIGFYYPHFTTSRFSRHSNFDVEWDWDYDIEVAKESLIEAMAEAGYEAKKIKKKKK